MNKGGLGEAVTRRVEAVVVENKMADYASLIRPTGFNPVKHRLVRRAQDWPHSSFHRDVRLGLFPLDWAGDMDRAGEFGERE